MRLSDLLAELEGVKEREGDIEIFVADDEDNGTEYWPAVGIMVDVIKDDDMVHPECDFERGAFLI